MKNICIHMYLICQIHQILGGSLGWAAVAPCPAIPAGADPTLRPRNDGESWRQVMRRTRQPAADEIDTRNPTLIETGKNI